MQVHPLNTEQLIESLLAAGNSDFSMQLYPNRDHGIAGEHPQLHNCRAVLFNACIRQEHAAAPLQEHFRVPRAIVGATCRSRRHAAAKASAAAAAQFIARAAAGRGDAVLASA